MSVDDFLGASFMEDDDKVSACFASTSDLHNAFAKAGEEDGGALESEDDDEGEDHDDTDDGDDESFASVDELDGTSFCRIPGHLSLKLLQTKGLHTCWSYLNSQRKTPSFSGISKKTIASSLTSIWMAMTTTTLVTTLTMLWDLRAIGFQA